MGRISALVSWGCKGVHGWVLQGRVWIDLPWHGSLSVPSMQINCLVEDPPPQATEQLDQLYNSLQ